jgi:hypothetical protein
MARPKVYLHWSATGYQWIQSGHYHTIVTGDGVVHRLHDYNIDLPAHTYKRNTNSIGLACACMAGKDPWTTPPTIQQLEGMCREVAAVIKEWGWSESDITVANIMTHAEAASNKDGCIAHENYGPIAWGGDGTRWDLMCLERNGPDDGGDRLRAMIRSFFSGQQTLPLEAHPLNQSSSKEMTVLKQPIEVLVDLQGVTWGKVSILLGMYGIPFVWDSDKRRILIGSSDVVPRYSQDKFTSQPGIPTFELALQGSNSPIILLGVIYQNEAYCQVLEFADELGISATFNPFTLHERRGG